VSASVPRRRRRRTGRRPSRLQAVPTVARTVVGVVGFAATVVGLVFVLWPSLKPDEPPKIKGATLTKAEVEPGMTFGQYLDRIPLSRRPYPASELRRRGAYVEFDFTVRGYKGKRLPLRWQLIESPSGVQLSQSQDLRVKPRVDTDSGSWNVWVPIPRRARRMYVQIQLYNDAGTVPIGRIRTAQFDAAGTT
jgi:hypothetical protein